MLFYFERSVEYVKLSNKSNKKTPKKTTKSNSYLKRNQERRSRD